MHNPESMNADAFNARSQAVRKSTLINVVVNILLSLFQIVVGVFSGSQGLIADGIHSLPDLVADFVVLIANIKSRKPSDSDHHYGHWRYENGASMILGALLFFVGVGMLWSAIGKILHPETIPTVHVIALWVALGALAAKELLFRYMLAVATRIKSSLLIANAWHARSDAASSLVVATGIVGNLMGHPYCDPIAALIVGVLVAWMSTSGDSLPDLRAQFILGLDNGKNIDTGRAILSTQAGQSPRSSVGSMAISPGMTMRPLMPGTT